MFSDTELDEYRKEFRKIGLSLTEEEMHEILDYFYVYGSMMYDMLDNELI